MKNKNKVKEEEKLQRSTSEVHISPSEKSKVSIFSSS